MLRRIGSALNLSEHSPHSHSAPDLPLPLSSRPSASASGSGSSSVSNSSNMNSSGVSRRAVVLGALATFLLLAIYLYRAAGTPSAPSRDWATSEAALARKTVHRIAFVTDLDHDSKDTSESKTFWKSFYREATLTRDAETGRYAVTFDGPERQRVLRTRLNLDGRGMELSWLARFGDALLAGDDRAGVVFDVRGGKAAARFVLADGDGTAEKGFKSEWAAVKDGSLYIGSFGKEWTTDAGEYVNSNPMWVKVVDRNGGVTHVDWSRNYAALRAASKYLPPGYLFHESGAWNPTLQRWVFVPRRASRERYNPELDETKGANIILLADAAFGSVEVRTIDVDMPADGVQPKGYSEIKFIPGQPNDILALRSMEYQGVTKSWITAFNIHGQVLMPDVPIDDYKFEGLEFI